MSDWISSFPLTAHVLDFSKRQLCSVLKTGPVPQHVGFIMDGNRRYARQKNIELKEGHNAGYESMAKLLEICYGCGVKSATVFAFSIENFNRSNYEIEWLMALYKTKFQQIVENGEMCEKYGVKIKIMGDLSLLPDDVSQVLRQSEEITKNNKRAILNVCCPYTSRDDITHSMKEVINLNLPEDEITEETLTNHLYSSGSPKLDLLIRTSGVYRLSDFMLWEIVDLDCQIEILDILWPEFGALHLIWILLKWSFNKTYYGKRMNNLLNINDEKKLQ